MRPKGSGIGDRSGSQEASPLQSAAVIAVEHGQPPCPCCPAGVDPAVRRPLWLWLWLLTLLPCQARDQSGQPPCCGFTHQSFIHSTNVSTKLGAGGWGGRLFLSSGALSHQTPGNLCTVRERVGAFPMAALSRVCPSGPRSAAGTGAQDQGPGRRAVWLPRSRPRCRSVPACRGHGRSHLLSLSRLPPLLLKSHRKTPEGWKIVLIKDRRPPSCSLLEKLPETKVSFVFRGPSRAWGHEFRAPLTRWTHGFRSWSWAGGGVAGGLPCTVGAELVSALQTTTDWHHWGGGWSQRHRAVPWDVKVLKAPRGVSGPFCTAQCL